MWLETYIILIDWRELILKEMEDPLKIWGVAILGSGTFRQFFGWGKLNRLIIMPGLRGVGKTTILLQTI